ncbi:DUF488 domain-containing protein [Bradyrhizobium sp. MOS001]|uniref:DUF488 domain-containing protein n=1 Tax=Bradyrhizobium sp. MOS001 TaxID=2133948 RepID=UPI001074E34E|nr:DUF488 domain-containing protein [Bradyrhizobium sp. MOS001]TFW56712.1 DUF488 domain-containing protein [Bradyrhizobium sp. MOS001]
MIQAETSPIYTIGHSTRSIVDFVELLKVGAIEMVVDIRKMPRSRANPQFNIDTLPDALSRWQIGYTRIEELGGLRTRSKTVPPQVNGFWINPSFHNYADYALSDEFRRGLSQLEELSLERRCAIMCSEAVWWRCHRRFVADYLLRDGRDVFHLMGTARVEVARMNTAARKDGASLVYPQVEPHVE